MALEFAQENIWYDKWRYDEAECQYYEKQYGGSTGLTTLASQIAKAREEIQSSLTTGNLLSGTTPCGNTQEISVSALSSLTEAIAALTTRVDAIEKIINSKEWREKNTQTVPPTTKPAAPCPTKPAPPTQQKKAEVEEEDEDDDVDLFGSDDEEEDEAAAKLREQRLKDYAAKKSKKPGPIAKSSVLLDCKPWDDETDMQQMEKEIRKIEMDGLTWGAAKLVPLAFGIKKLSILCTVEDEKVSIDDLIEQITSENEDFVQSVDIGAFNKI